MILLHRMDTVYNDMNGKFTIRLFFTICLGALRVEGRIFSKIWMWLWSSRKTTCSINPPAYASVSAWQNTAASFSRYIIQLSLCRIVVTLYLVAMATALSSGEYWSERNPCASVCAARGAFLTTHGPAWASERERETARETKTGT